MARFDSNLLLLLLSLALLSQTSTPSEPSGAPPGPWDAFNPAPSSPVLSPTGFVGHPPPNSSIGDGASISTSVALKGNGSSVTLDWGNEIGGILSFSYTLPSPSSPSKSPASLLLSFTESPLFIRPFASDDSGLGVPNTTWDGVLSVPFSELESKKLWTMPRANLRGGFRYLTVTVFVPSNSSGTPVPAITLSNITTTLTFSTHMASLRDYGGYFYAKDPRPPKWSFPGAFNSSSSSSSSSSSLSPSSTPITPTEELGTTDTGGDENFLTRLWYAGAYTLQTNLVPLDTGREEQPRAPQGTWRNDGLLGIVFSDSIPPPPPISWGLGNLSTLSSPTPGMEDLLARGEEIPKITLVDGAKRDRAVWPGDMFHALPTLFTSLKPQDGLVPALNALGTMFEFMDPRSGSLPESGPPLLQLGSDTYHMWTLIGVYNTFFSSGDVGWLKNIWGNYTLALGFIVNKTVPLSPGGSTPNLGGLLNVTGLRDWARFNQGGLNAEANAIFYKLLIVSAELAGYLNQSSLQASYSSRAAGLKKTFNEVYWDESVGMFKDNDTAKGAGVHPQDANSMAVLFGLVDDVGVDGGKVERIGRGLEGNWGEFGPVTPELTDCVSPFISGFELLAHFTSCSPTRASSLLHLLWGYILYTPLSVGPPAPTLIEGLTTNGSIAYRWNQGYGNDPSYTSHAHGWSTAPTSALMNYVLGVKFVKPAGVGWKVEPFLMGLEEAEGGFEGVRGWFGVKWSLERDQGTSTTRGGLLTIDITTPESTSGSLVIPACNGVVSANGITVDGKKVSNGEVPLQGGKRVVTVKFDSIAPI